MQQARTQYKALKTVEPLTLRADAAGGVTPSTGEVSPAALLGRVSQQYDNAARAQPGQIPLLDLARIGQRFLKEPPSSSTAERLGVMQIAKGVGSLGLGAAGLHEAGAGVENLPYLLGAGAAMRFGASTLRAPAITPRAPFINGLFGVYPELAPGTGRNRLAP